LYEVEEVEFSILNGRFRWWTYEVEEYWKEVPTFHRKGVIEDMLKEENKGNVSQLIV